MQIKVISEFTAFVMQRPFDIYEWERHEIEDRLYHNADLIAAFDRGEQVKYNIYGSSFTMVKANN